MYPILKTAQGEVSLTPELIQELGNLLPAQLKKMTFTEMIELGKAMREVGAKTGVGKLLAFFGKGSSA